MNEELLHPLMFIKPLDAIPRGQRRRRSRGRGGYKWRGTYCTRREAPKVVATRSSQRLRQKRFGSSFSESDESLQSQPSSEELHADLDLSETDSDDAEVPRRRSSSYCRRDVNFDEDLTNSLRSIDHAGINTYSSTIDSVDKQLLDDLRLSSESLSSSSSATSSEMTAPSYSDISETDDASITQGLAGSLKGDNYFWIHENPNPSVDDFKKMSLNEDINVVLNRFKLFCRDYSVEKASNILIEKLIVLSHKKCVKLLNALNPLFQQHFFNLEIDSVQLFGRIVMTVIFYWHDKNLREIASKFLTFLCKTCHIDPLGCHPFVLTCQNSFSTNHLSAEVRVGVVCCEISLSCEDYMRSINYLIKTLRPIVEKNDDAALDHMKLLIKFVFETLLFKNKWRPLCILFSNILDIQEGLDYPVDLTLFYDCIICNLVVCSETTDQKLALNLFQKVNYWQYFEASGVACRGLLVVAALLNQPRTNLNKIFSMCLNKGVYPQFNLDRWIVDIYSSMSKIEMQIYLEYCVRAYVEEIWSGSLNDCSKTFITFRITVVSSASIRDYVLPVHRKIKEVDHSFAAALSRLKTVIHHYVKIEVDSILHEFDEDSVIMFGADVEQLFKNVLHVESLDRSSFSEGSCVLCD